MRYGVIAPEFPPDRGGMQEHARGVVRWLAERHPVTVFTTPGHGLDQANVAVVDKMTLGLKHDADLIARHPIDVVLALSAGTTALAPLLTPPVIGYVHGHDAMTPWAPAVTRPQQLAYAALTRLAPGGGRFLDNPARRAIRRGFVSVAGLFANSRATANLVGQAYAMPEGAFTVVHPGVDDAFLQNVPRAPSPALRLLSIARLSARARRKNIDGVIRAVAVLAKQAQCTYEIIGDGDDLLRLRALATELGVGDVVRFLGDVDDAGVKAAYARTDLFVLATDTTERPHDIEGFGMVYVEAACSGLPSLATGQGGVAEAVADGVSGLLIPNGSVEAITKGLQRFLAQRSRFDPEAIREHGARLTYQITTAQLYEAMLARLPPRALDAPARAVGI